MRDDRVVWNFRLVKHTERSPKRVWYAVHEVFYTDKGKPIAMTQDPITINGESEKEVFEYLKMITHDIKRHTILNAKKTKWVGFSKEKAECRSLLKEGYLEMNKLSARG